MSPAVQDTFCPLPVSQMEWLEDWSLLPYSGKFRGRKTFEVLQQFANVFSVKLGGMASFGSNTSQVLRESFLRKNLISAKSQKFSPSKVSPYIVPHAKKAVRCLTLFIYPGGSGVLIRTAGLLLNKYLLYGIVNLLVSSGVVMATRP